MGLTKTVVPDGLIDALRRSHGLGDETRPRVVYLSLANDVARVQRYWAAGQHDPSSLRVTYAGMFYDLVEALGGQGMMFSTQSTDTVAGLNTEVVRVSADGAETQVSILEALARFQPHLVVASPSTPEALIPKVAALYDTIYYAHSLLWPVSWEGASSLQTKARKLRRISAHRARLKGVKGVVGASDTTLAQALRVIDKPVPSTQILRQIIEVPKDRQDRNPRDLLFLGVFAPHTGVVDLVTAYRELRAKGHDLTLTLAGEGPLRDLAQTWSTGDDGLTLHLGFDADKQRQLLQSAGVLVVPDVAGTLKGLADPLPEALTAGLPALVSSSLSLSETESAGCIRFDASDVESLKAAILKAQQPDTYAQMRAELPMDPEGYQNPARSWASGILQVWAEILT